MRIGVPRESGSYETLIAATPKTVKDLVKLGYEVIIESGAGLRASYPDSQFVEAGAQVGTADEVWASEIITKINAPSDAEIEAMRPGAILASLMAPGRSPELLEKLNAKQIAGLAMDAVPRISRAQSLDVLSSMANVAGYRAVIEAANSFGRLFTGQVTAAGKVPPATVYVIGAGVAGLAAIGTANSLGAIVKATDVRPEVAEQVQSMGADFVAIPTAQTVSTDGYAKAMTADQEVVAQQLYAEQAAQADIVITTAQIPGRAAPRLLTAQAVAAMRPGSVIVDMAAGSGGNCELTRPGEKIVTTNGVTILGYDDLASRLPAQTSQLYGTNIVNLFKLITPGKNGTPAFDFNDVVVRGLTVTFGGSVTWPPPPVQVSAAPAAAPPAPVVAKEPVKKDPFGKIAAGVIGIVLFILAAMFSPPSFLGSFTVFALAVVVGYYVIWNVNHALHTPLMSETNAISGIILVGAVLQIGSDDIAVKVISFIAILVSSINIFGGFWVTRRMLDMFRKG